MTNSVTAAEDFFEIAVTKDHYRAFHARMHYPCGREETVAEAKNASLRVPAFTRAQWALEIKESVEKALLAIKVLSREEEFGEGAARAALESAPYLDFTEEEAILYSRKLREKLSSSARERRDHLRVLHHFLASFLPSLRMLAKDGVVAASELTYAPGVAQLLEDDPCLRK